ncbi:hypothetical protein GH714_009518 [Hevea brasiliensis]|uniref:NAD-dependent epimerase/dehydratase domain-containing protein n=1 Tax=Hevea brasiliensis TaxID=3981 RepID=A0A6A6MHG2_HEVBR|nr:hypothetical protein GH714_009518 [Hevea brasiliensis]
MALLKKLFDVVLFTHVMHLAAQTGVRYAMQNPKSYVHSNIGGFVSLLEVCKSANPQPAIAWASSCSVYGLNSKVPFSEKNRTGQPASLYAATKKAGEEIAHTYNHIYGLSITGLPFFTVYGPWGRPDVAYFFFTKDVLKGKEIVIFQTADGRSVARDFTDVDDIVKGCLAALDTAQKSTWIGGKKRGAAQLRVFNLGNTSRVPVSWLIGILESLLKMKAKKKVLPLPRNGDVEFIHANISFAQRELGYKPTTDLETGLKKFVRCNTAISCRIPVEKLVDRSSCEFCYGNNLIIPIFQHDDSSSAIEASRAASGLEMPNSCGGELRWTLELSKFEGQEQRRNSKSTLSCNCTSNWGCDSSRLRYEPAEYFGHCIFSLSRWKMKTDSISIVSSSVSLLEDIVAVAQLPLLTEELEERPTPRENE